MRQDGQVTTGIKSACDGVTKEREERDHKSSAIIRLMIRAFVYLFFIFYHFRLHSCEYI